MSLYCLKRPQVRGGLNLSVALVFLTTVLLSPIGNIVTQQSDGNAYAQAAAQAQAKAKKGDKARAEWEKAKKDCKLEHPDEKSDAYKNCIKAKLREILDKHSGGNGSGNGHRKLKDNCDLTHPEYAEILDAILAVLASQIDNGQTDLINSNLVYDIKNEKKMVNNRNVGAVTQTPPAGSGTAGTSTTTFYNPKHTGGWLLRQERDDGSSGERYAQFADESGQFGSKFFIYLTAWHEMGYIMLWRAEFDVPGITLQWVLTWSLSLSGTGTPDQLYFEPNTGGYELTYAFDFAEGFATALSYQVYKLPSLTSQGVLDFIKNINQVLQ